ncbi:MAG: hypothetical protein LBJ14_10030 [Desulfarculales bacterium]|jgi:hypothetical protein|nr:hypothetical protein [Desulfarculales bacterium]
MDKYSGISIAGLIIGLIGAIGVVVILLGGNDIHSVIKSILYFVPTGGVVLGFMGRNIETRRALPTLALILGIGSSAALVAGLFYAM